MKVPVAGHGEALERRARRGIDDDDMRERPRRIGTQCDRRPIGEDEARRGRLAEGGLQRRRAAAAAGDPGQRGPEAAGVGGRGGEAGAPGGVGADGEHRLAARDQLGEGRDGGTSAAVDRLAARALGGSDIEQPPRPALPYASELPLQALPPVGVVRGAALTAGGPVKLRRFVPERVELPDHHAGLLGSVPAIDLELDREIEGLILAPRDLAVHAEGDPERSTGAALELKARMLAPLAQGADLAEPSGG